MSCSECGTRLAPRRSTGRPRRYCSRACQGRAYRRRRDQGRLSTAVPPTAEEPGAEELLEAAIDLADERGQVGVTLSALAQRTGRTLVAVQREAGGRDQLMAMMVQRIVARSRVSARAADAPATALRRLAQEEWDRYRAHPWLVEILASTRPPLVPAVLDASREMVESFMEIGLDTDTALHRYLALSGYIQGMALLLVAEQRESGRTGTPYRTWWTEQVRRLDRRGARLKHPWLSELTEEGAQDAFDADRAFQNGLRPILGGLTCN